MKERCRQICGDDVSNCFINNKKQIACIADMVINKVFGISSVVEIALKENLKEDIVERLDLALKETQELIDWIKFLQIANDLKTLISASELNHEAEKRSEMRFPLPEIYKQYLALKINTFGVYNQVTLLNFSRSGLRFKSLFPLETNSVKECILVTSHIISKEVSFNVIIRHCIKDSGGYIVGGQIEKVSDSTSFDFFKSIYDYAIDILRKQQ
ncbi:MAG: hypothetical protein HY806_00860 [Nitrospirae bacterium]|nr:hypothetical protein [Nitrospirota bacterium]